MKTKCANLVKSIIYPSFQGNKFTKRGLAVEPYIVRQYILKKAELGENVSVVQSGLVLDPDNQELGCSPDGIVINLDGKEKGVLEVKNLLQNNRLSFHEARKKSSSFCLELASKELKLKKNHIYYYQCQGLLNILKLSWLDFIVMNEKPPETHMERIYRDEALWTNKILPKLKGFYKYCMLPELAAPRHMCIPGIREPTAPWVRNVTIWNLILAYRMWLSTGIYTCMQCTIECRKHPNKSFTFTFISYDNCFKILIL